MSTGAVQPSQMLYRINDVPRPFPKALGLGLQHVLTMFGATIAVPLLLGPAMGFGADELAILVASVMLCSGVATFLQLRIGTRLPIIQGVSFAFLVPFFTIIAATEGQGPEATMQFIAGAIIVGSLVEMAVGWTGLIGRMRRFVSPVVIGPVIALIGLSLFEVGAPQAGLNWLLSGLVIVGAFAFALVLAPHIGFFRLFPILLAVLLAYLVAVLLTVTGVYGADTPGFVDFASLGAAPWVRNPTEIFFPWGLPQFSAGLILATLAGFLASIIESFGDYHSISLASGEPYPSSKQISRGIGAEGLGCFFTGLLGGFSSTSYTENIGLVALTKVASRYVAYVAAALLVILGLVAKFGALVATIPTPIVGGLYCTLFGLIAAIGLANSAKADLSSQRNQMIIGFIFFMGLSVPAYIAGVPALGYEPHPIVTPGFEWLGNIITAIASTSMAVAAILGLILDNVIPGTDEERGITAQTVRPASTEAGELPGGDVRGTA